MTPEETKKAIEVMQGYVHGKGLEYKWRSQNIWRTLKGVPLWNWHDLDYRIKPQQVSIPATEEELEIIGRGVLWCRNKKNPNRMGWIRHNDTLNKSDWLLFNSDTKCWEDWEEK